jgi:O-antigen ligase
MANSGVAPSAGGSIGLGLRALFTVGELFLFGTFVSMLAIDQSQYDTSLQGSPVMQVIFGSSDLFALAMILTSPRARRIVAKCWPVLLLAALALASTLWSVDPYLTFRRSVSFLGTTLFGLAVAARFTPIEAIRFTTRVMSLACVLSVVWVVIFPYYAVHQASDAAQIVHAGLWRGIFGHKISLGFFAGLTLGLLLFYRRTIFSNPIVLLIAVACSTACLWGAQSATGYVTAVVMVVMLHVGYRIARANISMRKWLLLVLVAGLVFLQVCDQMGLLAFIPRLLGKSPDLTGRETYWPFVLDFMRQGSAVGYGYGAGFAKFVGPMVGAISGVYLMEAHNGYIEMVVYFGYAAAAFVIAVHAWVLWAAMRWIIRADTAAAAVCVFPFAVMVCLAVLNLSESLLMGQTGVCTLLFSTAAGLVVTERKAVHRRAAGGAPARPRSIGARWHEPPRRPATAVYQDSRRA